MSHIFDHAKFSEKQASIALSLTDTDHLKEYGFKPLYMFEYGGRTFVGIYEVHVVNFLKNNPMGGDFYVWLQQNGSEVQIKK